MTKLLATTLISIAVFLSGPSLAATLSLVNVTIEKVTVGPGEQVSIEVSDGSEVIAIDTSCVESDLIVLAPISMRFKELYVAVMIAYTLNKTIDISYADGKCFNNRQIVQSVGIQ